VLIAQSKTTNWNDYSVDLPHSKSGGLRLQVLIVYILTSSSLSCNFVFDGRHGCLVILLLMVVMDVLLLF